jgi:hypothetical protein
MADKDDVHATIRAEVGQFKQMITESSLEGDTEHSDIYINVLEDEVQVLQSAPGEVVLTYCTFGDSFFDEITLQKDVTELSGTKSGEDFDYEVGAEAILDVGEILTYLDFASEGGTVELEFTGSLDNRLATYARANGALETWVKLPGSEEVLNDVPHWLPLRFNSANVYTNKDGDEAPTQIATKSSKVQTIINAVEEDRDAEYYPIVVEDEEFYIEIGDEGRSGVSGTLGAQKIQGPDIENYYYDGFEEIFSVLSGPVDLQTAPGNNPLSIVQTGSDDRVIRHINGSVNN